MLLIITNQLLWGMVLLAVCLVTVVKARGNREDELRGY